jgi:hypothetical protein
VLGMVVIELKWRRSYAPSRNAALGGCNNPPFFTAQLPYA